LKPASLVAWLQVQMTVETLQRDGWPLPDEVAAGQQVRMDMLM